VVRVIKKTPLREFWEQWPAAEQPLTFWYRLALRGRWRTFADVKTTFGQADLAKVKSGNTVVVFDIGGNKFRLIAKISYEKQKVYVLRVLTHKEYDGNLWKEQL